jgi:hypothetical protein
VSVMLALVAWLVMRPGRDMSYELVGSAVRKMVDQSWVKYMRISGGRC